MYGTERKKNHSFMNTLLKTVEEQGPTLSKWLSAIVWAEPHLKKNTLFSTGEALCLT